MEQQKVQILAVGISHKTAPIEVRERLALSSSALPEALARFCNYVHEGLILSTCNRTELYGLMGHVASGEERLKRFLADYFGVDLREFEPYLVTYAQASAIQHLFAVASGIDSMVLGEAQILGQVRQAFQAAKAAGLMGRVFSHLLRQSLSVGKRARSETEIARSAVSVSSAALELARGVVDDLSDCSVLVVGAGKMATLTLKHLRSAGVGSVWVTNRTYERATDLAMKAQGQALPFADLQQGLSAADIVISSTEAEGYIVGVSDVEFALEFRPDRPLFLVDLSVPRDIDPAVRTLSNVFLSDIDDLEEICAANLRGREAEVGKVREIIEAEAAKFLAWWASLEVVPTINELRSRAEDIRQVELRKALNRLGSLSDRDRHIIDGLTNAIVNKLLHHPIVSLKEPDRGTEHLAAVRWLFQLDEAG